MFGRFGDRLEPRPSVGPEPLPAPLPGDLQQDIIQCVDLTRVIWWDQGDRRILAEATPGAEVRMTRDPPLIWETLSRVDLVIAEIHNLGEESACKALKLLLRVRGRPPTLLITSPEPDNLRSLRGLDVDDWAWTSEGEAAVLARGVCLARQSGVRRLAKKVLLAAPNCSLVAAMVDAMFFDEQPVTRVLDLSRRCHASPRTLARRWKELRPEDYPVSLKTFLGWVLLIRAHDLFQRGMRPCGIAKILGIHERTLGRLANRLVDLTLSHFLELPSESVRRSVDVGLMESER